MDPKDSVIMRLTCIFTRVFLAHANWTLFMCKSRGGARAYDYLFGNVCFFVFFLFTFSALSMNDKYYIMIEQKAGLSMMRHFIGFISALNGMLSIGN